MMAAAMASMVIPARPEEVKVPEKSADQLAHEAREAAEAAAAREVAQAVSLRRDEVMAKLRAAAMAEDVALLREAVAEAEAAGLAHEVSIGKRKLAALGVQ
jgi:hypothetical protein